MSRLCACISALLLAGLGAPSWATPSEDTGLARDTIHRQYNEGNFEEVIRLIEDFRGRHETYSRSDSIFVAKHLSVVYTANPATRELGQKYMHELLALMPSAELVDMYVSDEIYRIFERVRKEFQVRREGTEAQEIPARAAAEPGPAGPAAPEAEGRAAPGPERGEARPDEASSASRKAKYYLMAGGAAMVAAGVTAYLLSSEERPEEKVYVVPR